MRSEREIRDALKDIREHQEKVSPANNSVQSETLLKLYEAERQLEWVLEEGGS